MVLFPAFSRNIVPPEWSPSHVEEKLLTQPTTVNNKTKYVAVVVPVSDDVNKGLKASDFDLKTLMSCGQLGNLKPARLVSLDPLAQVDMVSKSSEQLRNVADAQIAAAALAASQSSSTSESSESSN